MPGTRRTHLHTALAAVLVLCVSSLAGAAASGVDPKSPPAGHSAIHSSSTRAGGALDLWSAAQLARPRGRALAAAERHIQSLAQPDLSPPARVQPQQPAPALNPALAGIIRRVRIAEHARRGTPTVALTFDLCERAVHVTGYDADLVDALRAANARATFFAGGKWMRSHPERTQQLMADPRFEMASHAWTHANMAVAPAEEQERQILWTSAQFELLREELDRRLAERGLPASGVGPLRLFRLPYGRGNAATAARLNRHGLAVIQWDVVGEGGAGSAEQRARAIVSAVRPGSIILLHANAIPKDTAAIVRHLLPLLAQKGYATATVSELLASGTPETCPEGFFTTPGDNEIYDSMFLGYGTLGRAQ